MSSRPTAAALAIGAPAPDSALVITEPVGQRRILAEQFAYTIEIAGVTRGRQIDDGAA